MAREAILLGGPEDGARMAVADGTTRLVFPTTLPVRALMALGERHPDAPVPIVEHRYDYEGVRLADGADVFTYKGLSPAPHAA